MAGLPGQSSGWENRGQNRAAAAWLVGAGHLPEGGKQDHLITGGLPEGAGLAVLPKEDQIFRRIPGCSYLQGFLRILVASHIRPGKARLYAININSWPEPA